MSRKIGFYTFDIGIVVKLIFTICTNVMYVLTLLFKSEHLKTFLPSIGLPQILIYCFPEVVGHTKKYLMAFLHIWLGHRSVPISRVQFCRYSATFIKIYTLHTHISRIQPNGVVFFFGFTMVSTIAFIPIQIRGALFHFVHPNPTDAESLSQSKVFSVVNCDFITIAL